MDDLFDDDVLDDDIKEATSKEELETTDSPDEGEESSYRQRASEVIAPIQETEWLGLLKAGTFSLVLLPVIVISPLVRILPATWRIYHKLHKWSAWQMQRAAGADVLANVRLKSSREEVLPAKMVESEEDDKQRSGWRVKTLGDKRWDPSVQGGQSNRFGKADLIHLDEDDAEQGTWIEASIDAAFQLDRERYLFRDATIYADYNLVGMDPSLDNGQAAVADGGVDLNDGDFGDEIQKRVELRPETVNVSVERPGILEDTLVPISSRAGYDGQQISWNQYSNIKQEQADQEKLSEAKNAGWMAAKLDDVDKMDMVKWMVIIGVWSAVLLFHQDIGAAIRGIGGGNAVGSAADGVGMGLLLLFAGLRGE